MTASLIYVVGPSGSGKDSLIAYAREQLGAEPGVCFAHRYITRPADAGGENHVALTPQEFDARLHARLFALHWQSHGLHYGIGIEINQWLGKGVVVVVNGSRAHLPQARASYPELRPVHITVSSEILRQRLLARGRETEEQVAQRLARNCQLDNSPTSGVVIRNDDRLEVAGEALVAAIRQYGGVAACA
ncbi:MAG: phosphonate metabolism protein/1,5-bisphosphokinase (PRPP-forming) PhnN [Hylemonella sp.]|nr:phosphonate metabolism protein/1,5-bisphosphokinase (PRPP-forming) PhnN [Hylemonella sp.]MDP1936946.1 phosphonate metabolism protein/1,5-bisphosphokinase (PRPP-forming) PhnN [Hylemonella sp.]